MLLSLAACHSCNWVRLHQAAHPNIHTHQKSSRLHQYAAHSLLLAKA